MVDLDSCRERVVTRYEGRDMLINITIATEVWTRITRQLVGTGKVGEGLRLTEARSICEQFFHSFIHSNISHNQRINRGPFAFPILAISPLPERETSR
jgi:hypothetical protein